MTPFLVTIMGVSAPLAIGTDMVYSTVTKLAGSAQHYQQRSVNLEVALFLGLGSLPASLLGVQTLEWIKRNFDAEAVRSIMVTIIAVTLVIVGASLMLKLFLSQNWTTGRGKGGWDGVTSMSRTRRLSTVLFGAAGGYLVGLTSIGSGSVMAVILLMFYPLTPAVIIGTDIVHATVLSLVASVAHVLAGNVDWTLTGALLLGGVPGILVGSRMAPLVPARPLAIILAVMLIFVGARLLLS